MSDEIEKLLAALNEGHDAVKNRGKHMYEAYDHTFYGLDFLAGAALNRTMANIDAFNTLIRARNLVIAGALLRMQLDTALRFYAAFLVEKPHDFALEVLKGIRIDKLQDINGNRLTDSHLVKLLSQEFPWVKRVYQATSGYIHLSGTHIHHTINEVREDRKFSVKLSPKDRDLPDTLYTEAIEAFIESIKLLLKYIDGWIFTKNNPQLVAEVRARIKENENP
ncbi:hypothetical protein [Nitrosomonas sp. sh817]|jgi:hypothetical protein|uniref:hypothetical protein n=1 Tax=Nitrosomonas sp. sh817 TaxID=3070658 RepID=UPI0027DE70C3|nr:hypothetical protein [Nitrosomonas sp. sh817]WMJ09862.1 hypothetical protein RBH92_06605 [Nitrosomonas sp. sh817]